MTCSHLAELDTWFALALDVLAGAPDARRDVLLLVGGAGTPESVAAVTRGDCVTAGEHLFVYPPNDPGHALPLTAAFVEVAGLSPASWPESRDDVAADRAAVVDAIRAVDAALVRIMDLPRIGGAERLRALRMHAWKHELGAHVGVLARCYGAALPRLLAEAGDCAETRPVAVPQQRSASRLPQPVG